MTEFIIPLTAAAAVDAERVGPKAANLAALAQAGLPTPGGFCLSADAYRAQIATLGVEPMVRGFAAADVVEQRRLAVEIRLALYEQPIAPGILAPLLAAWRNARKSIERHSAVRSSALCAPPALTDTIAGHIQMMIVSIGLVAQPWQAGQLKVLGFGSATRIAQYPDVPTLAESGLPGYEAGSWYGLFAPASTPRAIIDKLNAETQRIFTDPQFRERVLATSFITSIVSSPEDFAARIRADSAKWGKVIRDANIKAE